MREGVRPLAREHERAALAYLARSPYEHVFLTWTIQSDRAAAMRHSLYVYLDRTGAVRGVASFGRQIVLAADDERAVDAFAQMGPTFVFERTIVGPRITVERYWSRVRSWHAAPRLVRSSQPLLMVDRARLRGAGEGVIARRARPDEWETVARHSAAMIERELEYDPRTHSAEFAANVREMIRRGLWWVGEYESQLCFYCNAGPRSAQTLQLQGIWTPPEMRGRGLATRALYGVCDELLGEVPTLSLYVNDFNAAALALYGRCGFERVGEFATLLF